MKKVDAFTEEITDNFSELYVESFMIRYLSAYPEKNLVPTLSKSIDLLNEKILAIVLKKLEAYGYDVNKVLKELTKKEK